MGHAASWQLIFGSGGLLADADGQISFSEIYDLTNPDESNPMDMRDLILANGYTLADREVVIHGIMTDAAGLDLLFDGSGGSVDPSQTVEPYYNAAIPAAVGEINVVPLPAAGWLMVIGFGGLAALRRRKTG